MKLKLNFKKSIEQNAEVFYEKSKKAKRKKDGVIKTIEKYKKELAKVEKEEEKEIEKIKKQQEQKEKSSRKKSWFEKFRWFYSSSDFLCIGGRDAVTNDIVIKKHAETDDMVIHTELPGSPFFVIKARSKKIDKQTIEETCIACASFSKAWQLNQAYADVMVFRPEQIVVERGDLPRGSFVIRGKRDFIRVQLDIAIGITDDEVIMSGPLTAINKHCKKYAIIKQGDKKTSDIAKKIHKQMGGDLDEIIRGLPAGGCDIIKFRVRGDKIPKNLLSLNSNI